MTLRLDGLRDAIAALDDIVELVLDEPLMRTVGPKIENAVRAGAIKHFEIVYEVAWKLMQRSLVGDAVPEAPATRRDLFRLAARNRLIHDFDLWWSYHEARNAPSHTYAAARADAILETLASFARDARLLLDALEARHA